MTTPRRILSKACPKCGCTLYPNMIVEQGCPRCLRTHTKANKRTPKPPKHVERKADRYTHKELPGWVEIEDIAFGKRKKR